MLLKLPRSLCPKSRKVTKIGSRTFQNCFLGAETNAPQSVFLSPQVRPPRCGPCLPMHTFHSICIRMTSLHKGHRNPNPPSVPIHTYHVLCIPRESSRDAPPQVYQLMYRELSVFCEARHIREVRTQTHPPFHYVMFPVLCIPRAFENMSETGFRGRA